MRLVMDNARFHHSVIVRELFETLAVRHFPVYMPPYSPHLNAIEYCFSVWAKFINHHEKANTAALLALVAEAIASTTIAQCAGYRREVTRYLILCSQGIPLRYAPPRLIV